LIEQSQAVRRTSKRIAGLGHGVVCVADACTGTQAHAQPYWREDVCTPRCHYKKRDKGLNPAALDSSIIYELLEKNED
jgi:hypothetical protein